MTRRQHQITDSVFTAIDENHVRETWWGIDRHGNSEDMEEVHTMISLLARVEAAKGPGPRLDGEIDVALNNGDGEQYPARVTASLDAAYTLARRLYPGASWHLQFGENYAWAYASTGFGYRRVRNVCPLAERSDNEIALAIIASLLKAKIAEETA